MHFRLILLEETVSTSSYIKDNITVLESFTVVQALHQTAGRGRMGRIWQDEKNNSLLASFLFKNDFPEFDDLRKNCTAVFSLAACSAVSRLGIKTGIKWPNDIYADGKKLGGILAETGFCAAAERYLIAGIGLNINQEFASFKNLPAAASLRMFTGKIHDLADLRKSLFKETAKFIKMKGREIHNAYIQAAGLFPGTGLAFKNEPETRMHLEKVNDDYSLTARKSGGEKIIITDSESILFS
ncbi:MAG: biotin--[acetyl-CoA-carboxylase] ligase [Spirochaetes bacterium GWF1_41_5]|nr:MAG: biotin--[acetyl-CoA-carboxylase] ligase [Spirochaetes bacterium GWF1_41_5]